MKVVRKPAWDVIYEGTNISGDIAGFVSKVRYTDHLHGESDDMSLTLINEDMRWLNDWMPQKGDQVELKMGYEQEAMLPCGLFTVDDLAPSGPPQVMVLSGLAAPITRSLRTKRSKAFEEQTLLDIAEAVAQEHDLTVMGAIRTSVAGGLYYKRITQNDESDLAFLKRLAEEHGFEFSVRGSVLTFFDAAEMASDATVATIVRGANTRYGFRSKTRKVYRACEVSYHDPDTKKLFKHSVVAPNFPGGDVLKRKVRCESLEQAEVKAKAILDRANRHEVEGTITTVGDPSIAAGVNVALEGWGKFDGKYQVTSTTHDMTGGGQYTTQIEVRHV